MCTCILNSFQKEFILIPIKMHKRGNAQLFLAKDLDYLKYTTSKILNIYERCIHTFYRYLREDDRVDILREFLTPMILIFITILFIRIASIHKLGFLCKL